MSIRHISHAMAVAMCACLTSCGAWHSRVDNLPDPTAPHAAMIRAGASVDFEQSVAIGFKPGLPRNSETFNASVAPDQGLSQKRLDQLLALVLHRHDIRVEVIGFTDNRECSGTDCVRLSERRAVLVYDLLMQKGVPKDKLVGPIGNGSNMALAENETDPGRQVNRRVEINLLPAKP